jgi:hypothetical protein
MNVGGWLLLSALFGGLMLVIQRAERKRRIITTVIMAIAGILVWRYGLYRIGSECDAPWHVLCASPVFRQQANTIAVATVNWAVVSALVINLLFWALLGRYNPPGSSDAIKVYGMDD